MGEKINFKSVGIKNNDKSLETIKNEKSLGFKTPLRFGTNSIFSMHTSLVDQIQDNLKNLILTNHGERLSRYDFGANLHPLCFEFSADDFDVQATTRIKTAVAKYMPFISLESFQTFIDRNNNEHIGKIRIRITYDIPLLSIRNKAIEVVLFIGG